MGGSGSSGKGESPDPGFFDWVLNPVGSIVGKVWGIELDPIASMAASQATNLWESAQGNEAPRMWFGDSWMGDFGAGLTGDESRVQKQSSKRQEERRLEERKQFEKRYGLLYGTSLLDDEEED